MGCGRGVPGPQGGGWRVRDLETCKLFYTRTQIVMIQHLLSAWRDAGGFGRQKACI